MKPATLLNNPSTHTTKQGWSGTQNLTAWKARKGQRGGHVNATVTLETGGPVADGGFYLCRE